MNSDEYYEKIDQINQGYLKEVNDSFFKLRDLCCSLHPIRLLAALTIKHLCHPYEERIEEGNPMNEWSIRIEFLAGLLVANLNETKIITKAEFSEEDIQQVEYQLNRYFNNLYYYISTKKPDDDSAYTHLKLASKIYSLGVRGESYPNKILDVTKSLYKEHEAWFIKNLGFTIDDAILLSETITTMNDFMANVVISLDKKPYANPDIFLEKYFLFNSEHLAKLSGIEIQKCNAFLSRLSQKFGYKNEKYPNTFKTPLDSSWDFNTLYERPIIEMNGSFYIPLISLLPIVLLHTFYFDLIRDTDYRGYFSNKVGDWLEKQVQTSLECIFSKEAVHKNLYYDFNKKKEEVDVLVKYDTKLLVFQCKFKRITHEAKSGSDNHSLTSDLTKGIAAPMLQGLKAKKYIASSEFIKFYNNDINLELKKDEIEEVILINIVFGDYLGHSIQIEKINQAFNLWDIEEYAWTVPLLDFKVVTEIIENPNIFVHYLTRRIEAEKIKKNLIINDEIELLGFYLDQGLWLDVEEYKEATGLGISMFSGPIDEYMHKKYHLKETNVSKPKQEMPLDFDKLIDIISNLDFPQRTDCILSLLDLDYNGRLGIMEMMKQTKETTLLDKKRHTFSFQFKNKSGGVCFVAEPCNGNLRQLFTDTAALASSKKQFTKSDFWIGLGYDSCSNDFIDLVIYLQGPNIDDPELDKKIKNTLKQSSRPIDIKHLAEKGYKRINMK